jgi:hypothetical protein
MALPYIIVSGLLGGISYSYYTTISKLELKDSSINYSLIDSKMKELVVTSNVSPSLGVNFKDKCGEARLPHSFFVYLRQI